MRAGLKWEAEGDRPSAFFYQKVQAKRAKKLMESLLDKTGTARTSQAELKQVVEETYTGIFASQGTSAEWQEAWVRHQHLLKCKVMEQQLELMDRPFTVEELGEALRELPNGKSPGHDGATQEFYTLFWSELGEMVLAAVQDAWDQGTIGEFFNKGLGCLCPKSGDLREVEQWRPITLLTLFYKLIAKALAIRIRPFMDSWVEPEQRGFVAGRNIADNLLMFREAKWHAYASNQEVTFLQLDYSKAYDRLEWHFLLAGLRKMGFGPFFCRWIEILCSDAAAEIIVNGDLTRLIRLFRSVRQGCPLAPYLFVLVADLFILLVKTHPEIKGLTMPTGEELKALAVADDSQVVSVTTAVSLNACLWVIRVFCLLSGLVINWAKTVAICSPVPCVQLPGDLNFVRVLQLGVIQKYLGVEHEASGEDRCIGQQLVTKLRNRCQQIQSLFHTLAARVVLLNTILMAQLWYFLAIWVPTTKEYQAICQTMRCFLWGKTWEEGAKGAKVSWNKVIQPKSEGRLGVIDPMAKAKALQTQWLLRSLTPGEEPWKPLVRFRLEQAAMTSGADKHWLWTLSESPSLSGPRGSSALWQSIWRSWKEVRHQVFVREPVNCEEVLSLPACGVKGVWTTSGEGFFSSAKVVSELTRMGAFTLYSERWMTRDKLVNAGLEPDLALEVADHLAQSLLSEVQAAASVKWTTQVGDWCLDLWERDGEVFYDTVLRITKIQKEAQLVMCIEYVLPTPEHAEGRLTATWQSGQGGPVTGRVRLTTSFS